MRLVTKLKLIELSDNSAVQSHEVITAGVEYSRRVHLLNI